MVDHLGFDLTSICVAPQLEELPMMVNGVFNGGLQEQYEATQKFRKLLSIGEPIAVVRLFSTAYVDAVFNGTKF